MSDRRTRSTKGSGPTNRRTPAKRASAKGKAVPRTAKVPSHPTGGARSTPQSLMPLIPPNANILTGENGLQQLPPCRSDFTRPWFLYDYVDPAAKFRRMDVEYDWTNPEHYVDMGEDMDALMDEPEEGTKPTFVYGYQYVYKPSQPTILPIAHRQRFKISLIDTAMDPKSLFGYKADDLCEVLVRAVCYGKDVPKEAKELQAPDEENELGVGKRYKVHAGYRRAIAGFLREIDLMYQDKVTEHNCLFRATYLLQVLDHFVDELPGITAGAESRWRSRALNPLLQRQLRGTFDQSPRSIMLDVGPTKEEAAEYYLSRDPLDPAECCNLLTGILYVWPVRWSLGHLTAKATAQGYLRTRNNTEHLLRERREISDEEWESLTLWPYEKTILVAEGLTNFYLFHMGKVVSLNPPSPNARS